MRHTFSGSQGKQGGVSPNPGMVKELKEWPTPRTKADLESFLGSINCYREHLDRFADTTACIYRLTGTNVKFDWGEEADLFIRLMSYNGGNTISFSEGWWWICIGYLCFR